LTRTQSSVQELANKQNKGGRRENIIKRRSGLFHLPNTAYGVEENDLSSIAFLSRR